MADVKAGVDAWSDGDFARAVREWQPLADKGDADAEFNLAQAYKMGRGVPMDLAKAEALYGAAARQGHVQASDIYGLLLFQRGERTTAMPYIQAAASRGDPRAQYILGVAHFNGDLVAKDWVRGYALVSLAQQGGLPQATNALKQMDSHIPLADRQKAVLLAQQIDADAVSTRTRESAAIALGTAPSPVAVPKPVQAAQGAVASTPPSELIRPQAKPPITTKPIVKQAAATQAVPTPRKPDAVPATAASGPWRVQLGAFGVAGNAEALWKKLSGRPELAGRQRLLVRSGSLTKLQAGGFSSEAEASATCRKLSAAGQSCLPTRD